MGTKEEPSTDKKFTQLRPLYISPYKQDSTKQPNQDPKNPDNLPRVFNYSLNKETNKIFVSNLKSNQAKTDMNLTQLFAKVGTITNLRVPTNKNGDERKPYCYIEYQNEEQARLAVERFDGYEFFKNKIKVAISAPPKREGGKLTTKQETKKKQQVDAE